MTTFAKSEVCVWSPQALPLRVPAESILYETDFRHRSDINPLKIAIYSIGGTWVWIGGLSYPLKAGTVAIYEISYAFPCKVRFARFFMRAKVVAWDAGVPNYLEIAYAWYNVNNYRKISLSLSVIANNFTIWKRVGGVWTNIATGTTPWGATPLNTELEFSGYADGINHSATITRLDTMATLTISGPDSTEYGFAGIGSQRPYDARFDHWRVNHL